MTFVLKKFEALKKEFNRAVTLVLDVKKVSDINDLKEPRKSELLFLQTLFTEIEKEIKISKKTTNEHSFILYGAMLLIIKDIEMNLSKGSYIENSNLYTSLRSCMGITKDNDLNPQQLTKCYKELNLYLLPIFKQNDSSQGFAENFALQCLEMNKLVSLLTTSYDLEKKAYELEAKSLTTEGSSAVALSSFKLQKEVNKEILSRFVSWVNVRDLFDNLVMKEKMDKKKDDIKALDKPRNIQLQFLTQLSFCLNETKTIKTADKTAIFTGAMYLIRGQIAKEYRCKPLYNEKLNSTVYKNLSEILHAKEECVQTIECLLDTTYQFLRYATIEPSISTKDGIKAPTITTKHPFAAIQDFSIKDLLTLSQEMICDCRTAAINQCKKAFQSAEEAHKKEEEMAKPKEKSSWNLYGYFSKSNKEGLKETDDLDEMLKPSEAKDTATEENTTATTSTMATTI